MDYEGYGYRCVTISKFSSEINYLLSAFCFKFVLGIYNY
jgi:hypothetical protein